MKLSLRDRFADRLISQCGSEDRIAELRYHFAEERAVGRHARLGDLGSLLALATRSAARGAVRDIPYWIAGLPFFLIMFMGLAFVYSGNFPGWDMVGTNEFAYTPQARFWRAFVDWSYAIGLIASVPAGRRLIEHGRNLGWSVVAVPALAVGLAVAGTQLGYLAPGTQGSFRPQSVNELWVPSIAIFLALAYVPVIFLLIDRLVLRRRLVPATEDGLTPLSL